ncbi:MAG TPA: hypothetical protein VHH12_04465, partial [Mycobacterium sp.]|nr:hypothetical protein [Mycobacterium sp.]
MTQTMKSMRDGLGVVVVSLAALALAAPVATAGKRVADFFPKTTGSGSLGGQFNEPRGIAVRHSTGQIYVADDNNHRVQRFSADGAFERAWGRNVSASQTSGNDGGNPAFAYEICTTASDCRGGSSTAAVGGFTGSRGGMFDNPQGVAVNQDTGHVYVRDRDNRRVQQFDADGNFIRAWGWDVTAGGSANFEICTVAADCKQATSGNGDGQFGASVGQAAVTGMAIDPTTGDVFVADPGSGAAPVNRRVQQFTSAGAFVAKFGTVGPGPGQLGDAFNGGAGDQPWRLTVGSDGIVYMSDGSFGGTQPPWSTI